MPQARAHATARARLDILVMQFEIVLRRCVPSFSDEYIERVSEAVRKRWIQEMYVYAKNSAGRALAQLTLSIDWNEHTQQLSVGNLTIEVSRDTGWSNETATEVHVLVNKFVQLRSSLQLSVEWRVQLSDFVLNSAALKKQVYSELNLVDSPAILWAGKTDIIREQNPQLTELTTMLRVVEDY